MNGLDPRINDAKDRVAAGEAVEAATIYQRKGECRIYRFRYGATPGSPWRSQIG